MTAQHSGRVTVASYNIRKCIGLDRRRDPERTLGVLRELDATVIAIQEADRRFGARASAIPPLMLRDYSDYRAVQLDTRPDSIGWHGNALLVREHVRVLDAQPIPLPTLEPRGAVYADLDLGGNQRLRVVGMHLDLSGIRRRQQVRAVLHRLDQCAEPMPTVLMGDLNEWSPTGGCLREFADGYTALAPGRSFHARRPVAQLDRIIVSDGIAVDGCGVHHSAGASRASDHLPVWAHLRLTPA